jgi:NAD(P)-dependent dehydrogenase (short-subunit alcohol dehydrogenase family)
MQRTLDNRIVLITGATRGIGEALSYEVAQRGAHVVVGARTEAAGQRIVRRIAAAGASAETVALDVTVQQSIDDAAATLTQRYGRLDVLVNNAGVLPEVSAGEDGVLDGDIFRDTFEVNVFGVARTTRAMLPLLRSAADALIINVSSTMGSLADQADPESVYASTLVPAYSASKSALNSLTLSLRRMLHGTSIRAVSVCPGFVQTELTPLNKEYAPLTAAETAAFIADVAGAASAEPFVSRDGAVAW